MDVASHAPAPLDRPGYLARITRRDGPAIEQAMAGATLLDDGARLDGAVIEASYAYDRPPLLKRLADDGVRRIVDPQSLRFTGERFLETEALRRLPYAPAAPINVNDFDAAAARDLARGSMLYAQDRGTDVHLVPGLPMFDARVDDWLGHNAKVLSRATALNGSHDIERKPLLALVAPGAKALADPQAVVRALLDQPIDGVYVQALRLNPITDSIEKLARFVQFLATIRDAGFGDCRPSRCFRAGAPGDGNFGLRLGSRSRRGSRPRDAEPSHQ